MEFKMHHAKALLVDLAISCVLHYSTRTLLKNNSSLFLLTQLWFVAGVKWVSLRCFLLGSWKDASVRRCVAVTCLMCPVYESGLTLLLNTQPEYWSGSLSCPGKTITSTAATLIACLFWEVSFPDTKRKAESSECAETKQRNRALFMRVVRYSKPDAPLLSGAFVFLSLAVICDMCIPYYTGMVIDILGEHYQPNSFMSAIFLMGLLSLGSSLSSGLRGGLFMCTLSRLNKRVRLMLFNSLVNQEIGFFEDKKTGDLTSRLSVDTKLMSQSVAMNVNILLRSLIKSVGVLYLMVSLSWKLTLVTFIEAPLIAITQKIYNTHYEQLSKEVQDSVARANETAGEAVAGVRTVRSFRMESSEACRYDERLTDTHNLKTRRDTVRAVYLLVRRLMSLGIQVLMLYYGRQLIKSGHMTTGNLVSFILYQGDLGTYIRTLVYMYSDMLNSVGAAAKVFEYLDRKPLVDIDGSLHPETLAGQVYFKNLTFFYPTRPDQPALKNFSLELKPGQMTALVGMSGGGKSTCVSLLERFYQPQQGQILLDGQPLQNYEHKYLHRKVAMVGQDPVLFSGSIRDNICYGLADYDQKKVEDAAKEANAHDFISRLEKSYDSDVGERGCLLSGGQKQRIAIARALIRQPQVLILDEVTSSLDTESERMVQDALARRPNQTLLVIAHRLKTIERADQIMVIDKGEVVEQGTHQELMEKKGNYYKLRERLFNEEKEADKEEVKQE
ncbi:antigen peptide transporter 2-like isoform X1 [Ctenopharyngodon idella]|uniref:antigen peptide transporter 2-like isoform X1 n=2 Tax=Ctenopharyngodon idella TaxID=7959 RepID=UPI002231CBF2|nr:antigen peptide transporter 2-like isoform X1 [Ctenopharyngodon idella]